MTLGSVELSYSSVADSRWAPDSRDEEEVAVYFCPAVGYGILPLNAVQPQAV